MASAKPDIVLIGPLKPLVVRGLEAVCTVHKAAETKDREAFFAAHATVRAIACSATITIHIDTKRSDLHDGMDFVHFHLHVA